VALLVGGVWRRTLAQAFEQWRAMARFDATVEAVVAFRRSRGARGIGQVCEAL